ncbi:hypothetical protein MASR2M8_03940 [Opitutaceae bacterium]
MTVRGEDPSLHCRVENIDLALSEKTFVLGPVDGFHLKGMMVNGKPYVSPVAIAAAPRPAH